MNRTHLVWDAKDEFFGVKKTEKPTILAIESSCDDTSAAIIADGLVLSNVTANQVVHSRYGGVVPELASRQHQIHILPVVDQALDDAGIDLSQIDAIGYTRGPGLMGSLLVGSSFAKGLALSLNIPLIEVHHMHAHVLAHFIEDPKPTFPFLCLTVSGGHTQIVEVQSPMDMKVIGTTLDDAAGEAFDKSGKMMGLPYPSGPVIDKLATEGERKFTFAKPRVDGLNFSFSGLKTSIRYFLRDQVKNDPEFIENNTVDICASVQGTIVDILMAKLVEAAATTGISEIAIAGGVSANSGLRAALKQQAKISNWNTYVPRIQYCTDNAGMIAMAAHFNYLSGKFGELSAAPTARLPF